MTRDSDPKAQQSPGGDEPRDIHRRDFIAGSLIGAGAALLGAAAPATVRAAAAQGTTRPAQPQPTGMTGLTDEWTGPGGTGDYANSNGNTHVVVNRGHGYVRNQELAAQLAAAQDTGETYDLVIVGAGIAGLSAAYQFRKRKPDASILILDMNDMFGGEAKSNIYDVDGYRLYAPQASNAVAVYQSRESISLAGTDADYSVRFHPLYVELGLPTNVKFQEAAGLSQPIQFPVDTFYSMLRYPRADVGYFWPEHGWFKNPYENGFRGTPLSDRVKLDLMTIESFARLPYREDYEEYLSNISYKEFLKKELGVCDEAVEYYDNYLAVAMYGLGSDAVHALELGRKAYDIHRFVAGKGVLPVSHNGFVDKMALELPGGNATVARRFVSKLIPDAYPDSEAFGKFYSMQMRREALDRPGQPVRLRLNSTVFHVAHDGAPGRARSVLVAYDQEGRRQRVRAGAVIMCGQQHANKKVCKELPPDLYNAMDRFHHGPVLSVNVILRNWRFMDKLGIAVARWFNGFGWHTCVSRKMLIDGHEYAPLEPGKPTIVTLYIGFVNQRGLPPDLQARVARLELFGLSFADIEKKVTDQFTLMFKDAGFNADRDIAGIIANRNGHAYAVIEPGGYLAHQQGKPAPRDVIRNGFHRIAFAHAELRGVQAWTGSVGEAERAVDYVAKLV